MKEAEQAQVQAEPEASTEETQNTTTNSTTGNTNTGNTNNSGSNNSGNNNSNNGNSNSGNGNVTPPPAPPVQQPEKPAPAPGYSNVIAAALQYEGKPYVWGATGPDAFDCSGLTQAAFAAVGKSIGRNTVAQESAGTRISVSEAQPGDLYFWGAAGATYHVAIATGGGSFFHAPQPGQNVGYGSIQYFTPSFAVRVN